MWIWLPEDYCLFVPFAIVHAGGKAARLYRRGDRSVFLSGDWDGPPGAASSPGHCGRDSEVISVRIRRIAVFEMGEDERRLDEVSDLGGAGGDVSPSAPASGQ